MWKMLCVGVILAEKFIYDILFSQNGHLEGILGVEGSKVELLDLKNTYLGVIWAEKIKNDIYFSQNGHLEGISESLQQ